MEKITVCLVDDHALLREGVRKIISLYPDLEVVGEVTNGEDALRVIPEVNPDVVLLDINLPDLNGIQVILRLRSQGVAAAIIVLTVHDDRQQIIHALQAGAVGFCAKDVDPDKLAEFIRQVCRGNIVVGEVIYSVQEAEAWLAERVKETYPYLDDAENLHSPLSQREMEILEYVTGGYTNQQIAYELRISHQTVKNHMTSILRKLNVQDRTQAAVYAIRQGWVRVENIFNDAKDV